MDLYAQTLAQAYPIRGMVLHTPAGRKATLQGPTAAAVMERSRFDHLLARHAVSLGAKLQEGWKVTGLLAEGPMVRGVRGPQGEMEGDLVILATGGTSSLSSGAYRKLLCIRRHVTGALHGKGLLEMVIRPQTAPGYAWLFPEGHGLANVGLCVPPDKVESKQDLAALMDDIQDRELAPALAHAELGPDEFMGIRCSLQARAPNRPGLWVVGEAAGLVNAVTGEGIGQALASGRLAAKAAASLLDAGEQRARRQYERDLTLHLTPSLASAAILGHFVTRPKVLDALALVAESPLGGLAARVSSGLVSP